MALVRQRVALVRSSVRRSCKRVKRLCRQPKRAAITRLPSAAPSETQRSWRPFAYGSGRRARRRTEASASGPDCSGRLPNLATAPGPQTRGRLPRAAGPVSLQPRGIGRANGRGVVPMAAVHGIAAGDDSHFGRKRRPPSPVRFEYNLLGRRSGGFSQSKAFHYGRAAGLEKWPPRASG